jgi:hypothetical protein
VERASFPLGNDVTIITIARRLTAALATAFVATIITAGAASATTVMSGNAVAGYPQSAPSATFGLPTGVLTIASGYEARFQACLARVLPLIGSESGAVRFFGVPGDPPPSLVPPGMSEQLAQAIAQGGPAAMALAIVWAQECAQGQQRS